MAAMSDGYLDQIFDLHDRIDKIRPVSDKSDEASLRLLSYLVSDDGMMLRDFCRGRRHIPGLPYISRALHPDYLDDDHMLFLWGYNTPCVLEFKPNISATLR